MEKMTAYCGLVCTDCDAYIATEEDDEERRKKIAEQWSEEYGAEIEAEDVLCDGCLNNQGDHISHWEECEIRICNEERGLENCAHCDDYICEKLEEYVKMSEEIRTNLEKIRESVLER